MLPLMIVTLLSASPSALLFDAGNPGWLVMSASGERLRLLPTIGGQQATEAAVSADGHAWAAIFEGHLYLWKPSWASPREVNRPAGDVLTSPSFSADGNWVYFIQNDFASMQRLNEPMRYSQVWRVSSAGGTAQKLTSSPGCHMWPTPLPKGQLLVTHATCRGGRSLDVVSPEGVERILLGADEEHGETGVDATGMRAVVIKDAKGELLVIEVDLRTGAQKLWARLPWRARHASTEASLYVLGCTLDARLIVQASRQSIQRLLSAKASR